MTLTTSTASPNSIMYSPLSRLPLVILGVKSRRLKSWRRPGNVPGMYFKKISFETILDGYSIGKLQSKQVSTRLLRLSCFFYRILGKVWASGAGSHIEVRGRLIGLAEKLGVAIAESSVPDAEVLSDEIRKLDKNNARNAELFCSLPSLPRSRQTPCCARTLFPFVSLLTLRPIPL